MTPTSKAVFTPGIESVAAELLCRAEKVASSVIDFTPDKAVFTPEKAVFAPDKALFTSGNALFTSHIARSPRHASVHASHGVAR